MLHQNRTLSSVAAGLTGLWLATTHALAWDYAVHRVVNQLALASLPTNFPAFVRTPAAGERIAFLSGEPDRWRNTPTCLSNILTTPTITSTSRSWNFTG